MNAIDLQQNLISLDNLAKVIIDANLTDEQYFNIRGVKPVTEIDGIQYWDHDEVHNAIQAYLSKDTAA